MLTVSFWPKASYEIGPAIFARPAMDSVPPKTALGKEIGSYPTSAIPNM